MCQNEVSSNIHLFKYLHFSVLNYTSYTLWYETQSIQIPKYSVKVDYKGFS